MNYRDYQDAGFKVFGLYGATNGVCDCDKIDCESPFKHPSNAGWQNTPEWDEEQLEAMEMAGTFDTGYGVLCDGYLVVDIDARNGGVDSWRKLNEDLDGALLSCNFIVRTGSGGDSRHLYFKAPENLSLLGKHPDYPGIDFKSTGYVVGVGSQHISGAKYELLSGSLEDISDAPSKLISKLIRAEVHRTEYNGRKVDVANADITSMLGYINPDVEYDTWSKIGMAIHHTTNGEGIDLWDLWSAKGNKYPGIAKIKHHWDSFGKKEGITIGTIIYYAEANGWEQPVTFLSDEFSIKNTDGLFVDIVDIMSDVKKPDWLIKGILERGSMNLLFGESGAGKSLFAMDWAFCLAAGIPWHNHKIKKKHKVLYIMGEGFRGITMRFQALQQKYPDADVSNIKFSRRSINLLDPNAAEQIVEIVKGLGFIPDLIICDTLNRNMVGDENSTEDMGRFFVSSEILIKDLDSTFLTVHHSGHNDKNRSRGSSAIKAAMDAEFCVSKNGDGVKFSCTKSKDFSAESDMSFFIHEVELEGEMFFDDDEGKQITSVYLKYNGIAKKEKKINNKVQKALDSLVLAAETIGKERPELSILGAGQVIVSLSEWKPFFNEDKDLASRRQNFSEIRKELVIQGFAKIDGDYTWVI